MRLQIVRLDINEGNNGTLLVLHRWEPIWSKAQDKKSQTKNDNSKKLKGENNGNVIKLDLEDQKLQSRKKLKNPKKLIQNQIFLVYR